MAPSEAVNSKFLDATQHTIAWFWNRLKNEELDAQPPYQRNPVWQLKQKQYLIDSILNGYPVPEIYLQTTTGSDGSERHTIVDGQQRIRACMDFVAGEFALAEDATLYPGLSFDVLPDPARADVFGYKFVVRLLPALPDAEIRDIFGRLNRNNVALNRQELRHATYWGEFIQSMDELSNSVFWQDARIFTSNDIRRMLDIEYVSELVVAHLFGLQNKRNRIERTYQEFEDEYPDRVAVEQRVFATLKLLADTLKWPSPTRWSRKVDFFTLFGVVIDELERDAEACEKMFRVASDGLNEFAEDVTSFLRLDNPDAGALGKFTPAVIRYARGIRNSSDLGSRRARRDALRATVFGAALPEVVEVEGIVGVTDSLRYDLDEDVDNEGDDSASE